MTAKTLHARACTHAHNTAHSLNLATYPCDRLDISKLRMHGEHKDTLFVTHNGQADGAKHGVRDTCAGSIYIYEREREREREREGEYVRRARKKKNKSPFKGPHAYHQKETYKFNKDLSVIFF